MGKRGKQEYLRAILKRYTLADKKEKRSILDEFCKVCEYNRKYAIRLLGRGEIEVEHRTNRPAGRRKIFLGVLLKRSFAGRRAKIEPRTNSVRKELGRFFDRHSTYRVFSSRGAGLSRLNRDIRRFTRHSYISLSLKKPEDLDARPQVRLLTAVPGL